MKKIDRLKKEALEACEIRGHKMRRFQTMDSHRTISSCKVCDKLVCVDSYPLSNGIDISGSAVALECYDDDKLLIGDLWSNIKNGTIDENFFDLSVKVRKALK